MKVLVAGGSGLIGRALAARLLERGDDVVVLSRNPGRAQVRPGVRVIGWEPQKADGGAWTQELATADVVVNLAGESIGRWPWTPRRKKALRESRIVATRNLVSAMSQLPPERRPAVLINASGTDLYEGHDAQPADESTPPASTFLGQLCVDWEAEARAAENLGIRVAIVRMSLVIAPGASSLRILMLPFRLFVGGRIGTGRQWISWVGIDDAVGIMLRAIDDARMRGPINVTAADPRRQAEFARVLGRAMHRPSWTWTPAWLVEIVLGDQATLAIGSRRVWPAKALAAGYEFVEPRLEGALAKALP
jgi:uncharacterized protein